VPGEQELSSRGVSYCATCDAAFFRGKETAIVGGGDSAMEEAIFLSKFASKVSVIHRRGEWRASQIMLDRARSIDNLELVTPYRVESFESNGEGALRGAVLRNTEDGAERTLSLDGAFIAIGHVPNSELVEGQVTLDAEGYVVTEGKSTRAGLPGVFAAGDLVDHTYRQAVTAAGSGCQAALDAEWYLRDAPPSPEAHWVSERETGETVGSATVTS
jgi:thioredoxin reductase (NADPH)